MKFQTKAERAFHAKTAAAIAAHDWPGVERLYGQYGAYLELTEVDDAPPIMAVLTPADLTLLESLAQPGADFLAFDPRAYEDEA